MDYDDLFSNAYNSDNDILVTESDVNKEDYGNRYSKKEKGHAKGGLKLKFKVGDSYKMFTSDQVHDLIENIEYNPQLWDKRHEGYKDKVEKSKTWHMVEKNLGFLMVDRGYRLQKVWMALLGAYKRQKELLKGRSGCGTDEIKIDFEYYDRMRFVDSALSSSTPPPSSDSNRSVTKRLVEFDKEESLPRKRNRNSEDADCLFELFKSESRSIDKSIDILIQSLKEDKEVKHKSCDHQDIIDKISTTLKDLRPSDVFECKVALAQVCDSFMRRYTSHNTYSSYGAPNVNFFEQMTTGSRAGIFTSNHSISEIAVPSTNLVSPVGSQQIQDFKRSGNQYSSNQLEQSPSISELDEFRDFFVHN